MTTFEFETELRGESILKIPPNVVAQLPKSGHARIIIHLFDDPEDDEWPKASYEQFRKDDGAGDAIYDTY